MDFIQYRRSQIAELRMYEPGEDMTNISVSAPDTEAGSPKLGDMIARNPKNHADQWLVAAQYFRDNFEPLHEGKTVDQSARVSNLHTTTPITAGSTSGDGIAFVEKRIYEDLLAKAKTLAGSCLSQDETPGQEKAPNDFLTRLTLERAGLSGKLDALTLFLSRGQIPVTDRQKELLEAQRIHMSEYLAVLDARLADLGISERSAPVETADGA